MPLGSRIRRRLVLDYASRDDLLACLEHVLAAAGNPSLSNRPEMDLRWALGATPPGQRHFAA